MILVYLTDGVFSGNLVSGQSNKPLSRAAHALTYEQLILELGSDGVHGLSSNVTKQRLEHQAHVRRVPEQPHGPALRAGQERRRARPLRVSARPRRDQIVWITIATSGTPDMGLGFERAVKDIMTRPPQSLETVISDAESFVDVLVYGLWIAVLRLASLVLVVYCFGGGNLGAGCNEEYGDSCDVVYRARATTFACLTWFALFLAWEMQACPYCYYSAGSGGGDGDDDDGNGQLTGVE
ncbi:cation transporting ATPase [Daldinia bambusicola]|nr:cation transporting ATPase [Daldinia bambusicola]